LPPKIPFSPKTLNLATGLDHTNMTISHGSSTLNYPFDYAFLNLSLHPTMKIIILFLPGVSGGLLVTPFLSERQALTMN